MRIHQATYGERDRAHSLLQCSTHLQAAKDFARYTDLPDLLPDGISLNPYISGLFEGSYYVLSRTFPNDPDAARPGMVFTHSLFILQEEIVQWSDLRVLLLMLPTRIDKELSLRDIELNEPPAPMPMPLAEDVSAVVDALLASDRDAGPAIILGQKNFEEIISSIWAVLWPEARLQFTYRLSFSPTDIESTKLTLVSTPEALRHRWRGHKVVTEDARPILDSLSSQLLLGQAGGARLQNFIDELDTHPKDIRDLKKFEDRYHHYESLESAPSSAVLSLLHFIAIRAKEPEKAVLIKRRALDEFTRRILQEGFTLILSLRNLDLGAFKGGENSLYAAVNEWLNEHLLDIEHINDNAILIAKAYDDSNEIWATAIKESFVTSFTRLDVQRGRLIWLYWLSDSKLIALTFELVPEFRKFEQTLVKACPEEISEPVMHTVCAIARKEELLLLHAAAICACYKSRKVYRMQLAFSSNANQQSALEYIRNRLSGIYTVAAAIEIGNDEGLLKLAAVACIDDKSLLNRLKPKSPSWQSIWSYIIEIEPRSMDAIPNVKEKIRQIYEMIVNATRVNEDLFTLLATHDVESVLLYPKRAELWPLMPAVFRSICLENTAKHWIEEYLRRPGFETRVENELRSAIFSTDHFSRLIDGIRPNGLTIGLRFFNDFQNIERHFTAWLRGILKMHRRLNHVDALSIGRIICTKNWRNAIDIVFNEYSIFQRNDLWPAIAEFRGQLTFFQRGFLILKSGSDEISEDDWWEALQTVAVELYPEGISEQKIWKRADGNVSLFSKGSGYEQWFDALSALRNGGGGEEITLGKLIKKMRKDYSKNDKLILLLKLRKRFK